MAAPSTQKLPRVLFLDHVGQLGGAEMCLVDLARHAASRAHVLLMADGPLRTVLENAGVQVTVMAASKEISTVRRSSGFLQGLRTIPHVLRLAWRISKLARQYDVVWATSQKSFVIGCFAAALASRPLVWHMHDILTADHFSPNNRKIAVLLANRFAARVVAVSRAGQQSFIDSNGRRELVTVLYNGIDPAPFTDQPAVAPTASATAPSIREEFNIGDAPLVGVFGRLTPWKGQHILINALPLLPEIHALFVGEALFNEDEYAASLRPLAVKLGVADRAHFAGFRTDIPSAMREVNIIAHTSTSPEPFGRVIVEAMLARRPVIASAAGGAREIVTHGVDGTQIPAGNPAILADAIRQLLANPVATQVLVDEGYKTAISKFSLTAYLSGADAITKDVAYGDSFESMYDASGESVVELSSDVTRGVKVIGS